MRRDVLDHRHTNEVIGLQMCELFEQWFRNDTQVRSFGLNGSVLEQIQSMLKKPVGHIKAPISVGLEIADEMLSDAKAAATKINTHVMRLKAEFYYFLEGIASMLLRLRRWQHFSACENSGRPMALPVHDVRDFPFFQALRAGMGIIR